jgi:hypothetical protein
MAAQALILLGGALAVGHYSRRAVAVELAHGSQLFLIGLTLLVAMFGLGMR